MIDDVLYCFISHIEYVYTDEELITDMCLYNNIKNYIIVYGSKHESNLLNNNILRLSCEDSYECLPNKIHSLFYYLNYEHDKKYRYYAKLDRNIYVKQPFDISSLTDSDQYLGRVIRRMISTSHHFGKCSPKSYWHNRHFSGKYYPWCAGGHGYLIHTNSIKYIADQKPNIYNDIYEDVYVGNTLAKHKIFAKEYNIDRYTIHLI